MPGQKVLTSICVFFAAISASICADFVTVLESPFDGVRVDDLSRGFYIENYGANNLGKVILQYHVIDDLISGASGDGFYETLLTIRIGSYDGPILGETKYLSTYLESGISQQVVYEFGGISVTSGSLLTFTQALISGPGSIFYDTGISPHPQITQTMGTNPPLDSFRREQVGVTIMAIPEPTTISLMGLGTIATVLTRRHRRKSYSEEFPSIRVSAAYEAFIEQW